MSASCPNRRRLSALVEGASPGFTLVELVAYAAVIVTAAAFVLPFTRGAINAMNLTSDARAVLSTVSLAKMRAAASFTRARVYVDLGNSTFWVERWNKSTNAWVPEGVVKTLSTNVAFSFAGLGAPPPNTQPAIAQAPQCLDSAGVAVANTACIVFNSRGVPVDALGVPVATGAYYVTDSATVFGITSTTGGMLQLWRSNLTAASWALN